jgi:hypothetical protein
MPWYPEQSTNAFQDPREAKATMADVEAAYRRGAQQAAILLLQALSGDRAIERRVRYPNCLGRWRFGASLSQAHPKDDAGANGGTAPARPTSRRAAKLAVMPAVGQPCPPTHTQPTER